jgi:hypothetical protein
VKNQAHFLIGVVGLAIAGCATTGAASNAHPCSIVSTKKTAFGAEREYHKMLSIWVPASGVQMLDSGEKKTFNVKFGGGGMHHEILAAGTPVKFAVGDHIVSVPLATDSVPVPNASNGTIYTSWTASFDLEKVRPFIAADGLNGIRFDVNGTLVDIKVDAKQSKELSRAAACMANGGADPAMVP